MSERFDPNREQLVRAAELLGTLRDHVVFVGGCATGILITDPGAAPARASLDVDVIVEVASLAEYHALSGRLRDRGFGQSVIGAEPPYRWTSGVVKLDVMPTDESVLGFSNRWYEPALRNAIEFVLRDGLSIRMVTPPYFLGTKFEAFRGRGGGDYFSSHDFEDIIAVIDGRPEIVEEVEHADLELRRYLAEQLRTVFADDRFYDALPGLVLDGGGSPQRFRTVEQRMRRMAEG